MFVEGPERVEVMSVACDARSKRTKTSPDVGGLSLEGTTTEGTRDGH